MIGVRLALHALLPLATLAAVLFASPHAAEGRVWGERAPGAGRAQARAGGARESTERTTHRARGAEHASTTGEDARRGAALSSTLPLDRDASLGALALNAGVALDMRRPRLDGGGMADSALPNSFNGQPVAVDRVGRITSLDGMTLQYDGRGQLVHATVGAASEDYGIDAFYRRISLQSPTRSEFYVYEGDNIVATTSFGTSVQDRILYDGIDHPLRLERAGQKVFFELDLAGNVRRLRGPGGTDLGGYRYTAFGKTLENTATVDQPMRWKARWVSPTTGLYDVRARQWAAGVGVFVQIDEYYFYRSPATFWSWPGQNPAMRRDPYGRGDLGLLVGGTVGGAFGTVAGFVFGGGTALVTTGPAVVITGPPAAFYGGAAGAFIGTAAGAVAGSAIEDWLRRITNQSTREDETYGKERDRAKANEAAIRKAGQEQGTIATEECIKRGCKDYRQCAEEGKAAEEACLRGAGVQPEP
jgi:RHS repeat-associated protein